MKIYVIPTKYRMVHYNGATVIKHDVAIYLENGKLLEELSLTQFRRTPQLVEKLFGEEPKNEMEWESV